MPCTFAHAVHVLVTPKTFFACAIAKHIFCLLCTRSKIWWCLAALYIPILSWSYTVSRQNVQIFCKHIKRFGCDNFNFRRDVCWALLSGSAWNNRNRPSSLLVSGERLHADKSHLSPEQPGANNVTTTANASELMHFYGSVRLQQFLWVASRGFLYLACFSRFAIHLKNPPRRDCERAILTIFCSKSRVR